MSRRSAAYLLSKQVNLLEVPTEDGGVQLADISAPYDTYYRTLVALREEFHRTGRYDDANTKLDEIVKLLAMRFHEQRRSSAGLEDRFSVEALRAYATTHFGDPERVARALRELSKEILLSAEFTNRDGTSIFGVDPSLQIQPTDDAFANHIVEAVRVLAMPAGPAGSFDILNESFGHFVRDSFRNHLEDAQYMTPQEAVEAMVEMAFADIKADPKALHRLLHATDKDPFLVLDPTCGVGSFLVEALRRMVRVAHWPSPGIPDTELGG